MKPTVLCTSDATLSDSEVQSSVDVTAATAAVSASAAAAAEPERRQSRSLSIIARALGKGLDARRPSTVAAVFAAATSNLAPTRWSRRASSVSRQPAAENLVIDDVAARPRRLAANSVTWKDVGDAIAAEQRTDRNANTILDSRRSAEQSGGQQVNV